MDDIISRFDRPLTLINVFNIVDFTLISFSRGGGRYGGRGQGGGGGRRRRRCSSIPFRLIGRREGSERGGGEAAAEEMDVPFLGSLPFDPGFVRGGDDGVHRIISEPEGFAAAAFETIVTRLIDTLESDDDEGVTII